MCIWTGLGIIECWVISFNKKAKNIEKRNQPRFKFYSSAAEMHAMPILKNQKHPPKPP